MTKTAPGEPIDEALAGVPTTAPGTDAGEPTDTTRRLPKGTLIDHKYKIDRVLGEGGMGVVYLAEDVHTAVNVVLKAIRPELAHRKDIHARTLAEGRALARIDHANVVRLNAVVEDQTGLWLVMQYIEGESLDHTIKRSAAAHEPIALPLAVEIFRQILQGVAAAHNEGVIHRDLKPANVLVRRKDGVVKVTDFGIAKPLEQRPGDDRRQTKGVIGSLWYMSPEQVRGDKDLDRRADVYALGILFFELLTGRVPFNADSNYEIMRLHVEEPLPKVSAERSDVPPWVDELLARACAKHRDDRFASCEEFRTALEESSGIGRVTYVASAETHLPSAAGASYRPVAPPPDPSVVPPAPSGNKGLLIGLVAVAIVGAAGIAVWRSTGDTGEPAGSSSSEPAPGEESGAPTATVSAPPPKNPLPALVGRWKSEAGTELDAVLVADAVEFRIVDQKQLAPADYRNGEARFTLRASDEPDTFKVEEKMRPTAPGRLGFDARSRLSCQEVWDSVDGKPLLAKLTGSELRVDFTKIAPKLSNFEIEKDLVVACNNLRKTTVGRGRTALTRVP